VEVSSRKVVGACSTDSVRRAHMATLRTLANYDPLDSISLRRKIAGNLLAAGSYSL
jgi:hypothetical protein